MIDNIRLPFKITETHAISRVNGAKTPITPEMYLQAAIFDKLCEISEKLPIAVNVTNQVKKIPP